MEMGHFILEDDNFMAPTRTISRPLISTSFSPSKKQTENLLKLLLLRRRQGHKRFLSSSQIVLCLYNDIRATPFVPRPPIVVCLSSKSICQGVKAMLLICAQGLGWLLGGEVGMKLGRRTALESLIEQGRFWSPWRSIVCSIVGLNMPSKTVLKWG